MFVYIDTKENRIIAYSDSPDETFPMPDGSIGRPANIKVLEKDESELSDVDRKQFHLFFTVLDGQIAKRTDEEILAIQKEATAGE